MERPQPWWECSWSVVVLPIHHDLVIHAVQGEPVDHVLDAGITDCWWLESGVDMRVIGLGAYRTSTSHWTAPADQTRTSSSDPLQRREHGIDIVLGERRRHVVPLTISSHVVRVGLPEDDREGSARWRQLCPTRRRRRLHRVPLWALARDPAESSATIAMTAKNAAASFLILDSLLEWFHSFRWRSTPTVRPL